MKKAKNQNINEIITLSITEEDINEIYKKIHNRKPPESLIEKIVDNYSDKIIGQMTEIALNIITEIIIINQE